MDLSAPIFTIVVDTTGAASGAYAVTGTVTEIVGANNEVVTDVQVVNVAVTVESNDDDVEAAIIDGHYYIKGILQKGLGLVEFEGDYYYVKTAGDLATGYYYVNNPGNTGMAKGYYTFGDDYKMVK